MIAYGNISGGIEENASEIIQRKKEECHRKTLEKELKQKMDICTRARLNFERAQENFNRELAAFKEKYGE